MPSNRKRLALLPLLVWTVFTPGVKSSGAGGYAPGRLYLVDVQITDNGDGDGFADTNETLWIGFTVQPTPGTADEFGDCVARITTESPAIDCMRKPELFLADLPVTGPPITPDEQFEIKIGNIDRDGLGLGPDDDWTATLSLQISCQGGGGFFSDAIVLPLDLNVSDLGQTPAPWFEGFEDGTMGSFAPQNNDAGLPGASNAEGLENADGWRCQYHDPDWINSDTYNQSTAEDCYPGMNAAQANAVFWQVDGLGVIGSPDGGRAKSGTRSMYYGVFITLPASDWFTTPMSTVEAAGTTDPINLGTQSPRLSFWQQISLADHRRFTTYPSDAAFDRGVVQVQLTDPADTSPGNWTNLSAAVNPYASYDAEVQFNCSFDPIDDGNNEDDFFDPSDPDRSHGPSSTCWPARVWANQGDTSPAPFDPGNVGNATTPPEPSDAPSLGSGTWVKAEVDLTALRGRIARFRFLVSSIKASEETYHDQFGDNGPFDDGWWVDDIAIDETLAEPAEFSNDRFLLGSCAGTGEPCIGQCRWSLAPCSESDPCDAEEGDCVIPCPPGDVCSGPPPDCGLDCSEAQTNIFVEPEGPLNPPSVTTNEPGERVDLNLRAAPDAQTGAEPSSLDACVSGYMETRACVSGDPDGDGPGLPDADCDDAWDSPYCPQSWCAFWSTRSLYTVWPDVVTTYALEVRCSSTPDCRDGRAIEVVVDCPSGDANTLGLREIRALDRTTLAWQGPLDVDWLRGSFTSSADVGDYVADFTDGASSATSIPMTGDPAAGAGYYYLVKRDGPVSPVQTEYACDSVTWRSGGDAEKNEPARDVAFGDP